MSNLHCNLFKSLPRLLKHVLQEPSWSTFCLCLQSPLTPDIHSFHQMPACWFLSDSPRHVFYLWALHWPLSVTLPMPIILPVSPLLCNSNFSFWPRIKLLFFTEVFLLVPKPITASHSLLNTYMAIGVFYTSDKNLGRNNTKCHISI